MALAARREESWGEAIVGVERLTALASNDNVSLWNAKSRRELRGVHPDMIALVTRARELCEIPFQIEDGIRTLAEQKEYVRRGVSKTLRSRHLTGHAVDIKPLPPGDPNPYDDSTKEQVRELTLVDKAFQKASRELGVPYEWGWREWGWDAWHFQLPWKEYPTGATGSKIVPHKRERFAEVMAFTFEFEGGYVNDPRDPGGATNMGITLNTLSVWRGQRVTASDVRRLTKDEARQIYRSMYWDKLACDRLPDGVDWLLFDMGVAHGVGTAAKMLQALLGVEQDGDIGPITLQAANSMKAPTLVTTLTDQRIKRAKRLKNKKGQMLWPIYGKGWCRRWKAVESNALELIEAEIVDPPKVPLDHNPSWWAYGGGALLFLLITHLRRN